MTEKQKQQYLTAQQAREIATTPYRDSVMKIHRIYSIQW